MEYEDAFGKILFDTYQNRIDTTKRSGGIYYAIERDDDFLAVSNSFIYFLDHEQFPDKEKELLEQAYGRILELACGAGRMSSYLLEQGHNVLSTDTSSLALQVCEKRGLSTKLVDFTIADHFQFSDKFDTILIFGNSLPVVGSPNGLVEFLNRCWDITTETGKLLGDFNPPVPVNDPVHLAYHERNRQKGNPIGSVKMRVRYRDLVGKWFDFWLPTIEEFRLCVKETKWKLDLITDPGYYFILTKPK